MSSIFPLRDTVTNDDQGGPRLVDLDEETADEVFEALAAQTTRKIFLSLHEEPQTASDLAEMTDTSVQNVQYHLEKLETVELIDTVDTWYSERGSEMNVYAPTDESLVLFAGKDKQRSFRSLFNKLVGAAGMLVPSSLLAGLVASQAVRESETTTIDDIAAAGEDDVAAESVDVPEEGAEVTEAAEEEEGGDIGIAADQEDQQEVILDSESFEETEIIVTGEEPDGPVLLTDGGNVTQLPEGALTTTETASIDPALAAALAFFCGGLFVLVSLWLWYGTPGSSPK